VVRDVSKNCNAFILMGQIGGQAVQSSSTAWFSKMKTLQSFEKLETTHQVTSQKTRFLCNTAVRTSNL
jgi:hypothetical protein